PAVGPDRPDAEAPRLVGLCHAIELAVAADQDLGAGERLIARIDDDTGEVDAARQDEVEGRAFAGRDHHARLAAAWSGDVGVTRQGGEEGSALLIGVLRPRMQGLEEVWRCQRAVP